jgi:hypothetical protein
VFNSVTVCTGRCGRPCRRTFALCGRSAAQRVRPDASSLPLDAASRPARARRDSKALQHVRQRIGTPESQCTGRKIKLSLDRGHCRSSLRFPKAVGRNQFGVLHAPACSHHGVGCMSDFCSSRANSLWYPDSAESPEIRATFQSDIFGRHF